MTNGISTYWTALSIVYYRAKVVSIISSDATFDIEFEDGDINAGLERHCLRPLQPYHVGEQVQIRRMEDQDEAWWVDGTIVDIYLDDDESLLFDINVGNMVLEEISPEVIRRLDVAPDM